MPYKVLSIESLYLFLKMDFIKEYNRVQTIFQSIITQIHLKYNKSIF